MTSVFSQHNIGGEVTVLNGGGGRFLAAGTGDNTKITGQTIDRMPQGKAGFLSAVVAVNYRTSLTASATLSLALEYQESADGSSWDTAVPIYPAGVVVTDSGSGSTVFGTKETDVDLGARKRYVRFNVTPDLSAGATDTGEVSLAVVLGGADQGPI